METISLREDIVEVLEGPNMTYIIILFIVSAATPRIFRYCRNLVNRLLVRH